MKINDDLKLWQSLKSGNHAALEEIYRSHFSFLFHYGMKIQRNTEIVEDAIQELFIEIWDKRKGLSDTDKIRPYLTISLKRKIIRNSKKNNIVDIDEANFGSEGSFEDLIIMNEQNKENKVKLLKAMEKLSDRQKEIIYLKYFSGMDYDGIAQVMDLNYQSARNLVSRALKVISKELLFIIFLLLIEISQWI